MNKKGVFLSLTAILIVGSMIIVFAPNSPRTTDEAVERRLQDFTQDKAQFEEQVLATTMRTYTRQSLNNLARQMITGQLDTSDVDTMAEVNELLSDCLGSRGTPIDSLFPLQTPCGENKIDDSFLNISEEIARVYSRQLQYDVDIELLQLDIQQITAWEIELTGVFAVEMNDTAGIAAYERDIEVRTTLNTQGLIDPLTTDRMSGTVRRIQRTPIREWNETSFTEHVRRGTYVFDQDGPGYFDRLAMEDGANSQFGIHSVLPPPYGTSTQSSVDYDQQTYDQSCIVKIRLVGMSQSVFLPSEYTERYEQYNALTAPGQQYDEEDCQEANSES